MAADWQDPGHSSSDKTRAFLIVNKSDTVRSIIAAYRDASMGADPYSINRFLSCMIYLSRSVRKLLRFMKRARQKNPVGS